MATLTVFAEIDSYMERETDPDSNHGAENTVIANVTYGGGEKTNLRRAIGNFDVSALSGSVINSAKLVRLLSSVHETETLFLTRCTRPADWTELGVTWNKYDGVTDWTTAGGDYDNVGPPASISWTTPGSTGTFEVEGLKPFVEDALDNRSGIVSLIIRLSNEDPEVLTGESWSAQEPGGPNVWRLIIDYVSIGQPITRRRGGSTEPIGAQRIGRGW